MVVKADIAELWNLRNDRYAVMVVKHDYVPKDSEKFLHNIQSNYTMKNWSSLMLMNSRKCRSLRPEYVATAHGLELHQFRWLESEEEIGSLPNEWNHLVGEFPAKANAKILHYTLGGPWLPDFRKTEFADDWILEHKELMI